MYKKKSIEIAYFSRAYPVRLIFSLTISIVAKIINHQYSTASLACFKPHMYIQTDVFT